MVYSPLGSKLALMNGQTLATAFVPLPGGATVVYTASGISYYRHPDWLGSSRVASTPSRTKYYDVAYAPFGESYVGSGTTDLSFTGQNQDAVAGHYDFLVREYNPVHGRWISPDPAGAAVANPGDPQSLNRYVYALNTPLTLVDPNGLDVGGMLPATVAVAAQYAVLPFGGTFYALGTAPMPSSGGPVAGSDGGYDSGFIPGVRYRNAETGPTGPNSGVLIAGIRQIDPNSQECKDLATKIANIARDIAELENRINVNPAGLPEFAPGQPPPPVYRVTVTS